MSDRRRPFPRPYRAARNAAYRLAKTDTGVQQLQQEVGRLAAQVEELSAKIDANQQSSLDTLALRMETLEEMLHVIYDDDATLRTQLFEARATPEYEAAYAESEPLVSVVIPTFDNTDSLLDKSLPSVLSQSYERLEVIIVGDAAPPEVERAIAKIDDPRVRYMNLTVRGPYPRDAERRWLVAGSLASNEGWRRAAGHWIAPMDDDDVCAPDRIEVLLAAARERQLEYCYGRIRQHNPDGSNELIGDFPPAWSKLGLQASLMHSQISFFDCNLGDAVFGVVGDWARIRRMMRVGVRFGMVDQVVVDYYPGRLWRQGEQVNLEGAALD